MDTSKLVLGQKVGIADEEGHWAVREGEVVNLTPSGVEVKDGEALWHFDRNGRGRDDERDNEGLLYVIVDLVNKGYKAVVVCD